MSISLVKSALDKELFRTIVRKCTIKPKASLYSETPEPIICIEKDDEADRLWVPLGIWKDILDEFPVFEQPSAIIPFKKTLLTVKTDPKGYRDQDVVFKQSMKILKETRVLFLNLPTGFGKTTLAHAIASKLGLKTAVICHIDTVNRQWKEEFKDSNVELLSGKKMDPEKDVYIMGVRKASLIPRLLLEHIGLVIYDEAHLSTKTAMTSSLLNFEPQYVIALTATPERSDGLQTMFDMYFGSSVIKREEIKPFVVYKVETNFKPSINYKIVNGQTVLDWNLVINSIASQTERHEFISNIAVINPNHKILILSNRKEECEGIHDLLESRSESVKKLIGTIKHKKTDHRIIVAGMKKAGIGFDDPDLNMAIMVTDVKDTRQFEGRLRTHNCVIYDIVDDFRTFENHWKIREKWYISRGAEIKIIKRARSEGSRPMMEGLQVPDEKLF